MGFLVIPGSCNAANMYAEQLNDVLKYSCSKKVAAFFAEPIQVRWKIMEQFC